MQSKEATASEIPYDKLLKVTLGCADWEGSVAPPDSSQPASDPERRAWVLGILMGLVLMVAMLQVWRYWNLWAWGWVFFFSFVVVPFLYLLLYLPRKQPTAKMILIALSVGTYLSLLFH